MDAKLKGYVLVSKSRKLLTHKKWWASDDVTDGWIWSDEEIQQILHESYDWDSKPEFKQAAYLNRADGKTVRHGEMEKLS